MSWLFVVDPGGFHHKPEWAAANVLLDYPTEQRREATRRVGEGGLFAKVQLLAKGRVANAGHEAVLSDVDAHHALKRGSGGRERGHT